MDQTDGYQSSAPPPVGAAADPEAERRPNDNEDGDGSAPLQPPIPGAYYSGADDDNDDDDYNDDDDSDDDADMDDESDGDANEATDNDDFDDNNWVDPDNMTRAQFIRAISEYSIIEPTLSRNQIISLMTTGNFIEADPVNRIRELRYMTPWPRHREHKDPNRFPKVPNEEGLKLILSGAFGTSEIDTQVATKRISRRMLDRELGLGNGEQRKQDSAFMAQSIIPSTTAEQVIHYDDPVYSGQFSDDGNFFFSCCQDFRVRMYDTSNPYKWKHYKTVRYPWGQWTLTDASLSPDNRWLAYTSIHSIVAIAPTDPNDTGDPYSLDLSTNARSAHEPFLLNPYSFGIWSIRFSGNGRELVAGTNADSIVVYDIESRATLCHVRGHSDHVNAVCFADRLSPHIIYSGSDDCTIKVWDRRSMGDSRAAGSFVGHRQGLTYIDSKGDGRYLLSNGKDQMMKLWDLRMAKSSQFLGDCSYRDPSSPFDYRTEIYDEDDWEPHRHDNSVVTFRGHKVLRTLIRCHFSPPFSTNSRYVYSGSADGMVYVWNMDASLAGGIDVKRATRGSRKGGRGLGRWIGRSTGWETCVRDASWHPNAPILVASAWNGEGMGQGTCTLHAFNDSSRNEGAQDLHRNVDCYMQPNLDLFCDPEI